MDKNLIGNESKSTKRLISWVCCGIVVLVVLGLLIWLLVSLFENNNSNKPQPPPQWKKTIETLQKEPSSWTLSLNILQPTPSILSYQVTYKNITYENTYSITSSRSLYPGEHGSINAKMINLQDPTHITVVLDWYKLPNTTDTIIIGDYNYKYVSDDKLDIIYNKPIYTDQQTNEKVDNTSAGKLYTVSYEKILGTLIRNNTSKKL